MQLRPEARVANEIILNAFRTLKFSGFDADTQRFILDCIGRVLIQSAREDISIDERIQRIEEVLYGDTRALFEKFLGDQEEN